MEKIRLGISACLLGRDVRYDGGNKLQSELLKRYSSRVEWAPVCPEVECGLPSPREEMCLVGSTEGLRLLTVRSRHDTTFLLSRWVQGRLKQLELEGIRGFVLKSRSPSCGIGDARVFDESGKQISVSNGIFAEALVDAFPGLPVANEEQLRDARDCETFLDTVRKYSPL